MAETDLILMSLCIFLPSVFAAVLLFFPKGMEEYVRWFSLLGTAVTFVVSTMIFINYLGMLHGEREQAQDARQIKGDAPLAADQLGRVPWISRFNIDYYLGVDGISMPLILLT